MSTSTGAISKSYVSALDPMLDTREINRKVTDIYNEDELSDILGYGGNKMPTKQPVYYTFFDDPLIKYIDTTGATVTGSGTTIVSFAVTAATSGYTRKGDIAMCTNNNSGIVSNVTTTSGIDTITITSVSGANLTVTAGDKLSLYSRAVGENSTTPTNIRYGLTKQSNKFQIFNETSKITDIQNASTVEINFDGQQKWIFKDHWEKTIKMKSDINAAFWGGDMSVTSFSDTNPILTDPVSAADGSSGGGAIQTTRGVNKYIELYGTSLTNGTLGTYQKADLDNAILNLISIRAPKDYLVLGSTLVMRTIEDYYKGLGSSGVQSVRLVVNGTELDFTVDKVKVGRFTFHYGVMPILDHPVTFGYSKIPKSLYYLPFNNKVKVEGGGSDDQIRVRYVPKQTVYGNDLVNEVHTGALSVVNPNGNGMYDQTTWVTYQGLEFLAPQHGIKQQVLA